MCKHFYEPEPFVKPLEKIEMKKTLVAVAAMAAVTGAMADATFYGAIDQTYNQAKTSTNGVVTSSKTGFGAYQDGQSLLGVKGSEDLGNGMKASYLYEFGLATETTATPTNRQSYIGLSGGFGAFRIGKQYSQAFNNAVAADPLGATGGYGVVGAAGLVGYDGTEHPLRQDRGIQYDLPSFVPGLNASLTKVLGNANSAALGGVKTGDGSGIAINYTIGQLYAGYTTDSVINVGVLSTPTVIAASATNKNKLNTATLTYDFGMAKLTYNNGKMSVGPQFVSSTMYGVTVPMGAISLVASTSTGKVDRSEERRVGKECV
jgi:predicted porin